jgi:hypothetical protein
MGTFLSLFAILTAKNLLGGLVFFRVRQNHQADVTMRRWEHRTKLPILNWFLKNRASTPANRMERIRNACIIGGIRKISNTETFEHFVGVALNKRSRLKIRMPNQAVPKPGARRWSEVDIVY